MLDARDWTWCWMYLSCKLHETRGLHIKKGYSCPKTDICYDFCRQQQSERFIFEYRSCVIFFPLLCVLCCFRLTSSTCSPYFLRCSSICQCFRNIVDQKPVLSWTVMMLRKWLLTHLCSFSSYVFFNRYFSTSNWWWLCCLPCTCVQTLQVLNSVYGFLILCWFSFIRSVPHMRWTDLHLSVVCSTLEPRLTSVLSSPFSGPIMDSPQLSPFGSKCPLSMSTSFQMSTLSLPSQAPSSPVLNEGGSARLEEEEELRRKVCCCMLSMES